MGILLKNVNHIHIQDIHSLICLHPITPGPMISLSPIKNYVLKDISVQQIII